LDTFSGFDSEIDLVYRAENLINFADGSLENS